MLNLFCKWVYNFEVFILYFSDVFLNMPLWLRGSKNIDYYPTSLVAQTVKHLSTMWETWVQSLGQEVPWRRKWQSTPVLLPGKSHGQRSLVGYSPWGCKESDTTEWSSLHPVLMFCYDNFTLYFIGIGDAFKNSFLHSFSDIHNRHLCAHSDFVLMSNQF